MAKKCRKCYTDIIKIKCVCSLFFCVKCLGTHECSFSHYENNKRKIRRENKKLVGKKIDKI